jgi:hypothetical protein
MSYILMSYDLLNTHFFPQNGQCNILALNSNPYILAIDNDFTRLSFSVFQVEHVQVCFNRLLCMVRFSSLFDIIDEV